jgi:hypothetical protein
MTVSRNLGALSNLITAGSTYATTTTPPQFDNSTNLVTSAFVQRAIGNFSNHVNYTINTTLTAANAGQVITTATASVVFTLPLAGTVAAGTVILFYSAAAGVTVIKQGSDTLSSGTGTLTLNSGDTVAVESNGISVWTPILGSAQLAGTASFGASIATNGYQKLPSGLIIQWTSPATAGTGTANSYAWPIAFPTATLFAAGSDAGNGIHSVAVTSFTATTVTLYAGYNNGSGTAVYATTNYRIIGIGY